MQHIQGIAIDAARSNVDYHYIYICDVYKAFMQGHAAQVRAVTPPPLSRVAYPQLRA